MADTFTIKQHDTWPLLEAVLTTDSPPVAVNLTGATVKLILKSSGSGATVVIGACTITDAATGAVSYEWSPTDTAAVNTFNGEFEVTWADGKITTFPNDGYFTVEVKADLG